MGRDDASVRGECVLSQARVRRSMPEPSADTISTHSPASAARRLQCIATNDLTVPRLAARTAITPRSSSLWLSQRTRLGAEMISPIWRAVMVIACADSAGAYRATDAAILIT